MLKVLNAPYPLYSFTPRRLFFILGIGAFVSFFLYYFQPFGTAEVNFPNKTQFLIGYGLVISLSLIIIEFVLAKLVFQKLNEENWTVLKQMAWVLIYTSCALIACYLYKQWFFQIPIDGRDFFYFYKMAFTIAIFPIVIIILVDYIYQLQRKETTAKKINSQIQDSSQNQESTTRKIQLIAENGKDHLELAIQDLLFLQAADNYVEIHYKKEENVKKEMLRNTLQKMEEQIIKQETATKIFRCHRSFLVNLAQVKSIVELSLY